MVFKHFDCQTSISLRNYVLADFFSTWLPKIVLYLFLLLDFEGILNNNAITQNTKMQQKRG